LRTVTQRPEICTTRDSQFPDEIFAILGGQLLAETIILTGVGASVEQTDQHYPAAQRTAHLLTGQSDSATKGTCQLAQASVHLSKQMLAHGEHERF